ncbi:MAG: hypothetical protein ACWA49_10205, partial [Ruegeria sp.]
LTVNQLVVGSIPTAGAKILKNLINQILVTAVEYLKPNVKKIYAPSGRDQYRLLYGPNRSGVAQR